MDRAVFAATNHGVPFAEMGADHSQRSTLDRLKSGCLWLIVAAWTMAWLYVFLLGVGMSGEVCYSLPAAEQEACKSSQALMAGAFAIGVWVVPFAVYALARLVRRVRDRRQHDPLPKAEHDGGPRHGDL